MQLDVPHWQQRQHGECLVACVAMVLTHLGQRVQYDRLRIQLHTSTAGTFFSNLDRLRSLRFAVKREQGSLDILRRHLATGHPLIVPVDTEFLPHWLVRADISEAERITQHAVVVVGVDAQHVYVNDPDFVEAPQRVEIGWFDDAWRNHAYWYAQIRRRWPRLI